MSKTTGKISRIDKLTIDRDRTDPDAALERRRRFSVSLVCGQDVARSRGLQIAVMTALKIATRCFPGAVSVVIEAPSRDAPLLIWSGLETTLAEAFAEIVGLDGVRDECQSGSRIVLFGNAPPTNGALRATFDGWIANVGPVSEVERLRERDYCALASVMAGSLAISELFMDFASINIKACRRPLAISLWRPDAEISDPSALGMQVEFLPDDLWVLGLGHLGNAYLWSLSALPYADPSKLKVHLLDFDKVEEENAETGLLFELQDEGRLKTRVCNSWLEQRGFVTRLVERRFDGCFRRQSDEPGLALCGFDSNPARRNLPTADFLKVVDSGLGGAKDNFDTMNLHVWPNSRKPEELWPDLLEDQRDRQKADWERIAAQNPAYQRLDDDQCGRVDLAGKSIAVPFVGVTASCMVLAEVLRMFHRGPQYSDLKHSVSMPRVRSVRKMDDYRAKDCVGMSFTRVLAN